MHKTVDIDTFIRHLGSIFTGNGFYQMDSLKMKTNEFVILMYQIQYLANQNTVNIKYSVFLKAHTPSFSVYFY